MSEQILEDYLSQGLLTNIKSSADFKSLCSNKGVSLSNEVISSLYSHLQAHDEEYNEGLKLRLAEFFKRCRVLSRQNLETLQLQESISVEDLINSLYAVDQMLDLKLSELNDTLDEQTRQIQIFKDRVKCPPDRETLRSLTNNLTRLLNEAERLSG